MSKHRLSSAECYNLYRRIVALIKKSEPGFFKLKKLKGAMGYCEWEAGIILDYRREFIATLIHECIHYLKPSWSETHVLYAEKRVINSITSKQIIKLIKLIAEQL